MTDNLYINGAWNKGRRIFVFKRCKAVVNWYWRLGDSRRFLNVSLQRIGSKDLGRFINSLMIKIPGFWNGI